MSRFLVFGTLELQAGADVDTRSLLAHSKHVALLATLVVGNRGLHRRGRLAALLWPELDDVRARNALSTAVPLRIRAVVTAYLRDLPARRDERCVCCWSVLCASVIVREPWWHIERSRNGLSAPIVRTAAACSARSLAWPPTRSPPPAAR